MKFNKSIKTNIIKSQIVYIEFTEVLIFLKKHKIQNKLITIKQLNLKKKVKKMYLFKIILRKVKEYLMQIQK